MSPVTGMQRRGPTTLSLANSAPDHDLDGSERDEAPKAEAAPVEAAATAATTEAAPNAPVEATDAPSERPVEAAASVVHLRRGSSTMGLAGSAPDEDADNAGDEPAPEARPEGSSQPHAAGDAALDPEMPQLTQASTDANGLPMRPGTGAGAAQQRLDADGNPIPEDPERDPQAQTEADPVYAALMALMRAPMIARIQEANERGAQLAARKQALIAERGQMDASGSARQNLDGGGRAAGHHPPGLMAGLGMAAAGLGKGIGNAIGGAGKLLPTATKRRSAALENGIMEVDREMAALGGFRQSMAAKGYERTVAAADGVYRARQKLARQVAEFNDLFESSPKGKAYLRHIEVLAASRGVPTSEIRRSIHDLTDGSPAIERLRQHSANLCEDPLFADGIRAMEASAAKIRRDSETLIRGISSAQDNGFDISGLEKLSETIGSIQVRDSKLGRPGSIMPLDTLNAEMAAWAEKIQQFWSDLMDKLAGAFGRGRA